MQYKTSFCPRCGAPMERRRRESRIVCPYCDYEEGFEAGGNGYNPNRADAENYYTEQLRRKQEELAGEASEFIRSEREEIQRRRKLLSRAKVLFAFPIIIFFAIAVFNFYRFSSVSSRFGFSLNHASSAAVSDLGALSDAAIDLLHSVSMEAEQSPFFSENTVNKPDRLYLICKKSGENVLFDVFSCTVTKKEKTITVYWSVAYENVVLPERDSISPIDYDAHELIGVSRYLNSDGGSGSMGDYFCGNFHGFYTYDELENFIRANYSDYSKMELRELT